MITRRSAVAALACCWLTPALGQPQGGVARAFLKIEAQTETGVSYRDYNVLVGDANLELKLYEASADGRQHPEAVRLFGLALLEYVTAGSVWATKFSGGRYASSFIPRDGAVGKSLREQYPDIDKPVEDGGALMRDAYAVDFVLPFYWKRAKALARDAIAQM